MKPQPGWPGFLAESSFAGGLLRLLPHSPSLGDEPLTLPCARERCGCPRGTAAHAPPLPERQPLPTHLSFSAPIWERIVGRGARSSALAPWSPLVTFPREPTPSPSGWWAAGRPETPRSSRAPWAALHLFRLVITILSASAASLARLRARCGVFLCTLRAFPGSVPASWLCSLFRGWPRCSPF